MTDRWIERIEDTASFGALEPDWWALYGRCPSATPFQSPAWLMPWWRAFAPGSLAVIAVHEDGVLTGLAPYYREHDDHGCRLLPIGISLSDYCDILVCPQHGDAVARIAEAYSEQADWREWEFCELACDAAARALPSLWNAREAWRPAHPCPVIDLSRARGLDDVVPSTQRRKLRMARHRLERRGGWRLVSTGDRSAGWWLDALVTLHGARWRSRGEEGVLSDPRVEAFLALALPPLAARGLLRCYGIEIEGRLAGVYVGFQDRGRAYAWLGGLDPQFADLSPGTLLIGHALEQAIAEGVHCFDFLRGAEAYKYRWGAQDRWTETRTLARTPDGLHSHTAAV
jgi:CelD/BcsL family acetyltransferase involved in cellulose biosynthesis